jgi:hypothetical protein
VFISEDWRVELTEHSDKDFTKGGMQPAGAERYRLSVAAGTTVRVDVSRLAYDAQGRDVAVPPTGSATADFDLTTKNVAPLATASANNIYSSEYGPSMGNDDDFDTRYSAFGTTATNWYQLDWPEPVTVSRVIAYQLFPWESNLGIDYWDGAAWQQVFYLSGVPLIIDASFAPVTTTKLDSGGSCCQGGGGERDDQARQL